MIEEAAPLPVAWLGRVGYEEGARLQEGLRARIVAGEDAEALIFVEHDPVITLGRGAGEGNVLASPAALAARGVAVSRSSRGGDVTYHGPGQLVAYPVVRLGRGVVAHVEALAAGAVAAAASVGVAAAFRRDRPGVWCGEEKLAAIGVHVHRRVAVHGLALNVNTALDAFDLIVPCGIQGCRTTSLASRLGHTVALEALVAPFAEAFARAAGRAVAEADPAPLRALLSRG